MSDVKEAPRRTADTRAAGAPPPVPAEAPPAAAAAATPPEQPREVRPLIPARITLSQAADGGVGNIWTAIVPDSTPPEDLFDPAMFANKAQEMKAGDRIEVLTDGGRYDIGLRVRQTFCVGFGNQPNRVKVYQLWNVVPPPLDRHLYQYDLDIKHMGPYMKWCLMRGNDVVQQGHETQADAERARRNAANSRNTPPKG